MKIKIVIGSSLIFNYYAFVIKQGGIYEKNNSYNFGIIPIFISIC